MTFENPWEKNKSLCVGLNAVVLKTAEVWKEKTYALGQDKYQRFW